MNFASCIARSASGMLYATFMAASFGWAAPPAAPEPGVAETDALIKELAGGAPMVEAAKPDIAGTDALIAELVAESQKHRVERKGDPADPLYQAEGFAKMLASDPDEMGVEQRWIAAEHCRQGRWDEAVRLVGDMPGGHGPIAYAEIALAAANADKADLAADLLKKAEDRAWVCANGSQKDELMIHLAKTWVRLGDLHRARDQVKMLPPAIQAELTALTPLSKDEAMLGEGEVKKLSKEGGATPAGITRIALASAERQLKAGNRSEGLKLLDLTGQLCTATLDAGAHKTLGGLARLAREHKADEIAEKARQRLVLAANSYAEDAEWKAGHLVEAARLSLESGKRGEAEALVAAAAQSAPKVFMLFASESWIAVAQGHLLLGQEREAVAATVNALRSGLMHPHHRARAMAAVSTCLFYARQKLPLPASVTKVLEEIRTAPTTG